LLNNLPEQLSSDDKESLEFVKEFVELMEEINKSLSSLKKAYQNPIDYTEKIIKFLNNVETVSQTFIPLTEIPPK